MEGDVEMGVVDMILCLFHGVKFFSLVLSFMLSMLYYVLDLSYPSLDW